MDLKESREALQSIIDELVHGCVKREGGWTEDDISQLSASLPQEVVERLYRADSKYKFCAVCTITKKSQSSLHVNSACMWNASRDGFLCSQSENGIFYCILNVFAIGI